MLFLFGFTSIVSVYEVAKTDKKVKSDLINRKIEKAAAGNQDQAFNQYLPALKSYKDVKANIYTRAELNRVLNQLKRINQKG